jgi:hypothetical protein
MHAPPLAGQGEVAAAVGAVALDEEAAANRPGDAATDLALAMAGKALRDFAVGGEAVVGDFHDGGEDLLVGREFAGAIQAARR